MARRAVAAGEPEAIVAELLTDSYCLLAPKSLARLVESGATGRHRSWPNLARPSSSAPAEWIDALAGAAQRRR